MLSQLERFHTKHCIDSHFELFQILLKQCVLVQEELDRRKAVQEEEVKKLIQIPNPETIQIGFSFLASKSESIKNVNPIDVKSHKLEDDPLRQSFLHSSLYENAVKVSTGEFANNLTPVAPEIHSNFADLLQQLSEFLHLPRFDKIHSYLLIEKLHLIRYYEDDKKQFFLFFQQLNSFFMELNMFNPYEQFTFPKMILHSYNNFFQHFLLLLGKFEKKIQFQAPTLVETNLSIFGRSMKKSSRMSSSEPLPLEKEQSSIYHDDDIASKEIYEFLHLIQSPEELVPFLIELYRRIQIMRLIRKWDTYEIDDSLEKEESNEGKSSPRGESDPNINHTNAQSSMVISPRTTQSKRNEPEITTFSNAIKRIIELHSRNDYFINYIEYEPDYDSELGQGHFGIIISGKYRNQPVAIKCFKDLFISNTNQGGGGGKNQQSARKEKRVYLSIIRETILGHALDDHPNILKFIAADFRNGIIILEQAFCSLNDFIYNMKDFPDLLEFAKFYCNTTNTTTPGGSTTITNLAANLNTLSRSRINELFQFSNSDLYQIFYDIAKGLAYFHLFNIVHRDIKPGNILLFLDSNYKRTLSFPSSSAGPPRRFPLHAKICDFGLAKVLDPSFHDEDRRSNHLERFNGTIQYSAPEVLQQYHGITQFHQNQQKNQPQQQQPQPQGGDENYQNNNNNNNIHSTPGIHYSNRTDVFSFGIVMIETITREPFWKRYDKLANDDDDKSDDLFIKDVVENKFRPSKDGWFLGTEMDHEIFNLVGDLQQGCIAEDPNHRYSIEHVCSIFEKYFPTIPPSSLPNNRANTHSVHFSNNANDNNHQEQQQIAPPPGALVQQSSFRSGGRATSPNGYIRKESSIYNIEKENPREELRPPQVQTLRAEKPEGSSTPKSSFRLAIGGVGDRTASFSLSPNNSKRIVPMNNPPPSSSTTTQPQRPESPQALKGSPSINSVQGSNPITTTTTTTTAAAATNLNAMTLKRQFSSSISSTAGMISLENLHLSEIDFNLIDYLDKNERPHYDISELIRDLQNWFHLYTPNIPLEKRDSYIQIIYKSIIKLSDMYSFSNKDKEIILKTFHPYDAEDFLIMINQFQQMSPVFVNYTSSAGGNSNNKNDHLLALTMNNNNSFNNNTTMSKKLKKKTKKFIYQYLEKKARYQLSKHYGQGKEKLYHFLKIHFPHFHHLEIETYVTHLLHENIYSIERLIKLLLKNKNLLERIIPNNESHQRDIFIYFRILFPSDLLDLSNKETHSIGMKKVQFDSSITPAPSTSQPPASTGNSRRLPDHSSSASNKSEQGSLLLKGNPKNDLIYFYSILSKEQQEKQLKKFYETISLIMDPFLIVEDLIEFLYKQDSLLFLLQDEFGWTIYHYLKYYRNPYFLLEVMESFPQLSQGNKPTDSFRCMFPSLSTSCCLLLCPPFSFQLIGSRSYPIYCLLCSCSCFGCCYHLFPSIIENNCIYWNGGNNYNGMVDGVSNSAHGNSSTNINGNNNGSGGSSGSCCPSFCCPSCCVNKISNEDWDSFCCFFCCPFYFLFHSCYSINHYSREQAEVFYTYCCWFNCSQHCYDCSKCCVFSGTTPEKMNYSRCYRPIG